MNICQEGAAEIIERVPERQHALVQTPGGVVPHGKIKIQDVTPDEAHPLKNDIIEYKNKNNAVKQKKQERLKAFPVSKTNRLPKTLCQ